MKEKSFTPHHFSFENNIMFNQASSSLIKTKNGAGFTLIEVLTIVGILIVLIALSIPALRFFQKESDLNNSAEEIINTLRIAQNKTLASEGASQWGGYFTTSTSPHQYILFQGSSYQARATSSDEIHKLPETVEIYEINLWGGNEVVFERVTGHASSTSQFGKVTIRLKTDISKAKTVYIENSGQVGLTSPTIPSEASRIKDSRHVHFDYNQSVQEAVTLHLIFPDYPADNYDISFQDYLNIDKTEFDWEGIVLVGPEGNKTEQKLKIHTHSLTIFAAQFCIHRDRRHNDKTLNITLDTENLINYTGAGEESKGLSSWVGEPQRQ